MSLAAARALVVGAGGLGSPAARVLARAGVGTIGLCDDDRVDTANLHRQLLHRTIDAGRAKVDSAADALCRIAPNATIIPIHRRLDAANVLALIADFDVILDGSDNFATKFLVNDACVLTAKPFVHAAAIRWQGQLLAVAAGAPCYRCLFEEMPSPAAGATCMEAGVVGPVVGVVGALQAEAALTILKGNCQTDVGRLLSYDGVTGSLRQIHFHKNPLCGACGRAPIRRLDPRAYEAPAC